MDLFDGHAVTQWLFDYFTDLSCEAVKAYCEAGVDQIHLGDDVASQIGLMLSKDMWLEHLKPRMQRVMDTIRTHQRKPTWVSYHSDGDLTDLVDEVIDLGVDILNPVQPECMDLDATFERFGDRIAFFGGIGTQTTMPFGSPDDVRDAVAKLADAARNGCAVIAAPTHVLEPDVPDENIDALIEAVNETKLNAAVPGVVLTGGEPPRSAPKLHASGGGVARLCAVRSRRRERRCYAHRVLLPGQADRPAGRERATQGGVCSRRNSASYGFTWL